jgi:hypothetical protein
MLPEPTAGGSKIRNLGFGTPHAPRPRATSGDSRGGAARLAITQMAEALSSRALSALG